MNEPAIIKESGEKQRIDVGLTEAIANTLGDMILAGKTLYPKGKGLTLALQTGETVTLSRGQVNVWITRENVIPETGKTLRAYLDEKRQQKRINDELERQASIRENAEVLLDAVIKKDFVEEKEIYKVDGGVKTLTRIERIKNGSRTVDARLKAVIFGLERLNPQKYGNKVDVRNTHVIFDLSEIRKAREEMIREGLLEVV